jgi:hypothetical protein
LYKKNVTIFTLAKKPILLALNQPYINMTDKALNTTIQVVLLTLLIGGCMMCNTKKKPQTRKEQVEACLSDWDGSHKGLTDWVKQRMNDPGSFEHVETRYFDQTTNVRLIMTFRGRNRFGGVVTNKAEGNINEDCQLTGTPTIY